MSRLIVVSNRVAPIDEGKQSAGGLAVAVLSALKKTGGVWFGWSGETVEGPSGELEVTKAGRLTYATMDLSQDDLDNYYNGFSNSTLWPLFHYRVDLTVFNRRTYEGYLRVNRLFAERLTSLLKPDDRVWIHDYHLIPMGRMLRERGFQGRIGFFLHTPFPAPEILVTLPKHRSIVEALCAYDLVGFQTQSDLHAFTHYIEAELRGSLHSLGERNGYVINAFGRQLTARHFPISIETTALVRDSAEAVNSRLAERLRSSLVGRDLIIGVDRLDYSKGLRQRFEAFQDLLERFPEFRGHVSFMQIAPPTRSSVPEYIAIRRELEATAGHINGQFAEFDWMPIRYLNKSFGRRTLAGFYRMSKVGLVTPLRDGMNLVAKEYVACQNPDNPGVLVLSRFAGAAWELDSALIVNPYDIEGVGDALQRALTMPLEERKERHTAMMDVLERNDINAWCDSFVAALSTVTVMS